MVSEVWGTFLSQKELRKSQNSNVQGALLLLDSIRNAKEMVRWSGGTLGLKPTPRSMMMLGLRKVMHRIPTKSCFEHVTEAIHQVVHIQNAVGSIFG